MKLSASGFEDALSKIGRIKKVVSVQPDSPLKMLMIEVAQKIMDDFRQSGISSGLGADSGLLNSIRPVFTETATQLQVDILADDYWDYVNSGVNGMSKSYGSPYSFRNKFPNRKMAKAIQGWMSQKGIGAGGSSKDFESISYAISYNLKVKGKEPNYFIDNVLTTDFIQKISLSLAQELGKEVLISIK